MQDRASRDCIEHRTAKWNGFRAERCRSWWGRIGAQEHNRAALSPLFKRSEDRQAGAARENRGAGETQEQPVLDDAWN